MKRQVHELTDAELISKFAELKEELFNLRFRQATNQLENPKAITIAKKDVARVLTEAKIRNVDVKAKALKVVKKVKKTVKKAVKPAVKKETVEAEVKTEKATVEKEIKPVKKVVKKAKPAEKETSEGDKKVDAIRGVMTYGKK